MAQKPETIFRAHVRKRLKTLEIVYAPYFYYEPIQQRTITGSPDFFLCVAGLMGALELKSRQGTPSALQLHKMERIREAGGLAWLADPATWPSVRSEIEAILVQRRRL